MRPVGLPDRERFVRYPEWLFYRWRTGFRAGDFLLQQGSYCPPFSRSEGFGKAGYPVGSLFPAAAFFEGVDPFEPFHDASFFYVFVRLSKTGMA